jgi:putative ABC transport system ATP-binding protein
VLEFYLKVLAGPTQKPIDFSERSAYTQYMIRIEQVSKTYHVDSSYVVAVRDVTLHVDAGEFVALSGPSGSGKTTLLNMIGCIEFPSAGKIWIEDQDTTLLNPDQRAALRASKLGFVFQNFNLLSVLSARENVEYPLTLVNRPAEERRERAMACLAAVGLDRFTAHKPRELSGGQRQRVAIARALASQPELILADEPTANLDHKTGTDIIELMKTICQERRTTFIFSTHDPKVIERADRVIRLQDGCLV